MMQAMQYAGTMTALREAGLLIEDVWDHYLNMGGGTEELEVEAYLHGLMWLPTDERDCLAQAVNELLDDLIRAGISCSHRAPYSTPHDANRNFTPADHFAPAARPTARPTSSAESSAGFSTGSDMLPVGALVDSVGLPPELVAFLTGPEDH